MRRLAAAASTLCLAPAAALADPAPADNPAARIEAPTVHVIGTTPLPGIGVPLEQVPANVQSQTADDLRRQQPLDLSEQLVQNLPSVFSLPAQNNPWQPDVSFRGFSASPLLGAPQGVSVFLDGVRVNESFGDTVNWDLIAPNAISTVNLIPGSNPVFGLNTLGGALAVNTKSGFRHPGGAVQLSGGSFGRRSARFEAGGHGERSDFFAAGNFVDEKGWRDYSSSRVNQLFAKAGYEDEQQDLDVSVALADNSLEGVQALPLSMLDNRQQAYTWPDRTQNRLAFANLRASRFVAADHLVSAGLYVRNLRTTNLSSNVNDDFDPAAAVDGGNAPGSLDRAQIDTRGWGTSLQYTNTSPLAGRNNQLALGVSYDAGRTDFTQFTQAGLYTAERTVSPLAAEERDTAARTRNGYLGVYFTDTFSLSQRWHATVSGRWNRARIRIADASGANPALDGDHRYRRFNPAAGVNFTPSPALTAYASYSEGLRVATPMELTCADPAAPCKLPNNFLADPPLKPVISRTWETGARGRLAEDLRYSASAFRTDLRDDIQFVSSGGGINAGFFQNVGKTRRQGVELALTARSGPWTLSGGYSYVRATFESPLVIRSEANSSADAAGDIQVRPGDRLPAIPAHNLRLRAEYAADALQLGASLVALASQYARGDENNQDTNGRLPAYAVVNLDGSYRLGGGWELLARVNNLFDRRYDGFAVLGRNFFRGPGASFDAAAAAPEQFRSPGAPRGVWAGLRYAWSAR